MILKNLQIKSNFFSSLLGVLSLSFFLSKIVSAQQQGFNAQAPDLCASQHVQPTPPVLDQGAVAWCTTMTSATLLQHHYRVSNNVHPSQGDMFFSIEDINSRFERTDSHNNTIKERGALSIGSEDSLRVLNGVQNTTNVPVRVSSAPQTNHLERNFQEFISRLDDQAKNYFYSNPQVEVRNLRSDVHALNSSSDVSLVSSQNRLPVQNFTGNVTIPPFQSVRTQFSFDQGAEQNLVAENILRYLNETLSQNKIIETGICFNPMEDDLRGEPRRVNCGAHSMVIIGKFRDQNGVCRIRLQNSHGANWNENGHIDLSFDQFFEYSNMHRRSRISASNPNPVISFTHIDPVSEENLQTKFVKIFPNGNEQISVGEFKTGTVRDPFGILHGQGRLDFQNGDFQEGRFENGTLMDGTFRGIWNIGTNTRFEGQILNGVFHGQGRFINSRGEISQGVWENGRLIGPSQNP